MSDVGKEIGKQSSLTTTTTKRFGNNEFILAIAKIAVAQLCENEGFHSIHNSPLESLADVAVRYIMEVGKISTLYANDAGRTECNVLDVIRGLEDLGSIQGFPGASDVRRPLPKSGTVREISQFVGLVEGIGIPFVVSLPRFPVSRVRNPPSSFLQLGKDPPQHIPAWLPTFPVTEEPGLGDRVAETHRVSKQIEQQRQKEEAGLLNANNNDNGTEVVETNPFLAPPFAYGEKEVSLVELPNWGGYNHPNNVNVRDIFAAAVETARNEVVEVEERDEQKHVKLDEKPAVRFKLSSGRKSLRTSKNVVAQTNGVEILFERGDDEKEKDEKKRRAEQILKDSVETPLDTTEV